MPENSDNPFKEEFKSFFAGKYPPKILSMTDLRNFAVKLFDDFIHSQSGLNPDIDGASFEDKCDFLTVAETETIVRDFSRTDVSGMFAVGGDTPDEALDQMRKLLSALVERVMSNVIAAGASEDLIAVAFDDDSNNFIFSVTEKGHALVETNKHLWNTDTGDSDE